MILRQLKQKHIPACHTTTYQAINQEAKTTLDPQGNAHVRRIKCMNMNCQIRKQCGFTEDHYLVIPKERDKRMENRT